MTMMGLIGDKIIAAGPVYAGVGDVLATSVIGYWGMRAWTLASIGNNCLSIRNNLATPVTHTYPTVAGGGLNTSLINFDLASTAGNITYMYDQTGTLGPIVQGTNANQPGYVAPAGTGGLTLVPSMSFNGSSQFLTSNPALSGASQPISGLMIAKSINNATNQNPLSGDNSGTSHSVGLDGGGAGVNAVNLYTNASPFSAVYEPCTDGHWHCIQFTFNGASSAINVDGADYPGLSISTVTLSLGEVYLGVFANNGALSGYLNGYVAELALWSHATTSTERSNLYNNAVLYYGSFPI